MPLKEVLYRTRVHMMGGWKKALMMHPLLRVVFISLFGVMAMPSAHSDEAQEPHCAS